MRAAGRPLIHKSTRSASSSADQRRDKSCLMADVLPEKNATQLRQFRGTAARRKGAPWAPRSPFFVRDSRPPAGRGRGLSDEPTAAFSLGVPDGYGPSAIKAAPTRRDSLENGLQRCVARLVSSTPCRELEPRSGRPPGDWPGLSIWRALATTARNCAFIRRSVGTPAPLPWPVD